MSVRTAVGQLLIACVGSLAAAISRADAVAASPATAGTAVAGPTTASLTTADPAAASPTSTPDYGFCTVCHGTEGNGNPGIRAPKIAGIEPWYLKRQLEHFRSQLRGTQPTDVSGMEMQPVAMQLDDKAIDAVALYVGTFTPKAPPKTVSGDVKHGRQLYTSCAACHGPKGEGNSALHAPALAGQTDWYLVTELQDFQAGLRGLSPQDDSGTQMRAAASALADESAIKDVVAYINTLPRR
jgi:cytochrome c553